MPLFCGTLRVAHRRGQWLQADGHCEPACVVGRVARTVVAQPLEFGRRMQLIAKPVFHCSQHHIAHDVAAMACRRGRPAHHFTVAAVQRERHAQRLAVVAARLEAVGAPSLIAATDGHLAVVPALRPGWYRSALHQQPVRAHDAVDTLCIERHQTKRNAFVAQRAPDPAIAVAGQIADDPPDFLDHARIAAPPRLTAIPPCSRTRQSCRRFASATRRELRRPASLVERAVIGYEARAVAGSCGGVRDRVIVASAQLLDLARSAMTTWGGMSGQSSKVGGPGLRHRQTLARLPATGRPLTKATDVRQLTRRLPKQARASIIRPPSLNRRAAAANSNLIATKLQRARA